MNTNGPDDDDSMRDATIVRPRRNGPDAPAVPAAQSAVPSAPALAPQAPVRSAPMRPDTVQPAGIDEFLGSGRNPLVQAACPLLLLAVQLRHSVSPPDSANLREQVVNQVRAFENHARAAGVAAQAITAARYVLCTMLDESVLNSPWGEHSGWAEKTLLVIFHGESYGGEKFFLILDRLRADVARHIDLLELMYICLTLGFAGRYQIQAGGRAQLADIQEELYARIKAQREPAAQVLAPHWQGIEDRRNPLLRYIPLWVIAAAAACVLMAAFLYFYSHLNTFSSPVSAQAAQIGLENVALPGQAARPKPVHKTLKELLAPEAQAGQLAIIEQPNGRELVRISGSAMFASASVEVNPKLVPLLQKVAQALDQVPGHAIVVGHTDDQPIHSLKYKDNYALSAARARAVTAILSRYLDDPARLESSGAGSSKPIALPPDLAANRKRNRRVDIVYIPGD